MCLGIPMTIIEGDEISALCERGDEKRRVSLLLIGAQPVGTKVLVHIDSAIRTLDEDEAAQLDRALDGLAAALRGEDFEHAFADLIERGPQLPDHLR
ncbi:HypC/HybG/HupF family hydrogenase formation chaperone [Rhodoblastus sp.]|uniref:HypC/HybG/HupF family hydrogenase formation chaperone n=1 Tax=Rhodoblastus sp. TaxID=1962975 RepID=UPI00262B90AC|nr:HypC/HybG/HupF family hydrogenase formation chaperone [Rhodoblastus sp.]